MNVCQWGVWLCATLGIHVYISNPAYILTGSCILFVQISSNGLLTFGYGVTAYSPSVFGTLSSSTPHIGVLWYDGYIRSYSSVYYRVSTDYSQLHRSKTFIHNFLTQRNIAATFSPTHLVVITWYRNSAYSQSDAVRICTHNMWLCCTFGKM